MAKITNPSQSSKTSQRKMPSQTKKQHNPKFAKKAGVPQSVGKEFLSADKGKKFAGGGIMKDKMKMVAKKEVKGHEERMHKGAKKMKSGGSCGGKGYARGGGIERKGKTKGKMV
jgi:hypothetical protein